jgi:hypothetical protein
MHRVIQSVHFGEIKRRLPSAIALGLASLSLQCSRSASKPTGAPKLTVEQLFDLRAKCSNLGERFKQDAQKGMRSDDVDLRNFTNHYDEQTNRCLVEISGSHAYGESVFTTRTVFDAQENKEIAGCEQQLFKDKLRPISCTGDGVNPNNAGAVMDKLMNNSNGWPAPDKTPPTPLGIRKRPILGQIRSRLKNHSSSLIGTSVR